MLTGLEVQYPEPEDCPGSVTLDSTRFEALASTGAYPCFSSTKGGKVTLALRSTTSLPLRLTSTPTMSGVESTGTGLDTAAALAVLHVVKQNKSVSAFE
ncbi:hypothetical protein [Amnibacterium sp.]|uniref:hypothetical protein n=1 Tax=Amnibacterium sp. TaxID=1872496 RepID=UPI003F7BE594